VDAIAARPIVRQGAFISASEGLAWRIASIHIAEIKGPIARVAALTDLQS
jgi:hypothetical protein